MTADERLLAEAVFGKLIGLSRAIDGQERNRTPETDALAVRGLRALQSGERPELKAVMGALIAEKKRIVPNCFDCASPCGRTADYDVREIHEADEETREIKRVMIEGLIHMTSGMDECSAVEGKVIWDTLFAIGLEWDWEGWKPFLHELRARGALENVRLSKELRDKLDE